MRASACAITLSARERGGLTTSKRSREQPEQVGQRGRTGSRMLMVTMHNKKLEGVYAG